MRMTAKPVPQPVPVSSAIDTTPARLRWSIEDLQTKDGHRLTVVFYCTLARVDEPSERKLFDEVFTSRGQVTQAAIIAHFLPALRTAASEIACSQSAEVSLSPGVRPQWIKALQSAANEVGFMCGIKALPPFEIEITSPTVQRERLEQMQRIAAERRSADRTQHFAKAADLLKQWESLKADLPSITPGKLLEQINPADRGAMLDTLLMASAAGRTGASQPDLWAVSGPYLVQIDTKVDAPQPQLISLPPAAGPLRSVRFQNGKLMVGARSGVLIVDTANTDHVEFYHHPTLASEYGFTAVTQIGNQIWACHRDGGLVGWKIGNFQQPTEMLPSAQLGGDPKYLTETGLFSVKDKLFKLMQSTNPDQVLNAKSTIVALLPMGGQMLIATESGAITVLDSDTLEMISELQTTGPLAGAALLPWLSASRLLLNRTDGPIDCIGLEDQLVTQFSAGYTGSRTVTAFAGKVAAMSSDRQRVVLWNAWDGRRIAGEIYLAGMTRHRIADITFG